MDAPFGANCAFELFGEPGAVTVSGRSIQPVRVDLGRQDRQLVSSARFGAAGILQYTPKCAIAAFRTAGHGSISNAKLIERPTRCEARGLTADR